MYMLSLLKRVICVSSSGTPSSWAIFAASAELELPLKKRTWSGGMVALVILPHSNRFGFESLIVPRGFESRSRFYIRNQARNKTDIPAIVTTLHVLLRCRSTPVCHGL